MVIIIRLMGGVGNQMFQYALGKVMALSLNRKLVIETGLLKGTKLSSGITPRNFDLDIFNIDLEFFDLDLHVKKNDKVYSIDEIGFRYDPNLFELIKSINHSVMLTGYWQSYKYLEIFNNVIKTDFTIKAPLINHWEELSKQILSTESIMLNVRRTDYLQKLHYHGVVTKKYLQKAISLVKTKIPDPYFFIFSDDINWCKENIGLKRNIFFVDEKYYDNKYQFYLKLMTLCKHFILSNSSFAWWSAYLGAGSKSIVILPKEWFKVDINTTDLTPVSWIKLSMY